MTLERHGLRDMLRHGLCAGVLALGFTSFGLYSPAVAADLGGDCCADLEERVAELEATAVRSGNRKVKVSVSGHVNESLLYFDSGGIEDVFQVTNIYSSTRVRIVATGRVNADVTAGSLIEFELVNASSASFDEESDDGASTLGIRKTAWFLNSKSLGRLTVGQSSLSTDDIILKNLGGTGAFSTSDTPLIVGDLNVFSPAAGFLTTRFDQILGGAGITNVGAAGGGIGQIALDTSRSNSVRYDTPTFAGFFLSVAAGEDDVWDAAVHYAGGFGDFKINGGIGYLYDDDDNGASATTLGRFDELKGSASIIHNPTGLYLHGAFVHRELEGVAFQDVNGNDRPDFDTYYVQAGVKARLNSFGPTTFFGEYGESHDGVTGLSDPLAGVAEITDSEAQIFGFGVKQDLDAVGMELYITYRNVDVDLAGDLVGGGNAALDVDDLDLVFGGARFKF